MNIALVRGDRVDGQPILGGFRPRLPSAPFFIAVVGQAGGSSDGAKETPTESIVFVPLEGYSSSRGGSGLLECSAPSCPEISRNRRRGGIASPPGDLDRRGGWDSGPFP